MSQTSMNPVQVSLKRTQKQNSRNGKIEFLRFVFAIAVLLFHLGKYIIGEAKCGEGVRLSLFVHGSIGVEFFFLVSGYLMAKTAYKLLKKNNESLNPSAIAGETWQFILRKFRGIWFYHVITWLITLILYCYSHADELMDVIRIVLESIPSLFLIQMSGIKCISPNHVEWYLSAMIMTMFIIYPFILRFGKVFTRVIAPMLSLVIVGYLSYTTGRLTGVSVWMGITYKSVYRAIADLCLGIAAYELSESLKTSDLNKKDFVLLTALEYGCYIFVLAYTLLTLSHKYEVYALIALFVAVSISFSNITYGNSLFSRDIVYKLGELSLPIYLSQVFVITIVTTYAGRFSTDIQIVGAFIGVIVLSVVLYCIKGVRYWNKSV